MELSRETMLRRLVDIQYERNDVDFHRGSFRVRGDVVEIFPPYEEDRAIRVEFFGDVVDALSCVDPLRGKKLHSLERIAVYPGSHYVTTRDNLTRAIAAIGRNCRQDGQAARGRKLWRRSAWNSVRISTSS
jgi:excinuclease ABC subunit B